MTTNQSHVEKVSFRTCVKLLVAFIHQGQHLSTTSHNYANYNIGIIFHRVKRGSSNCWLQCRGPVERRVVLVESECANNLFSFWSCLSSSVVNLDILIFKLLKNYLLMQVPIKKGNFKKSESCKRLFYWCFSVYLPFPYNVLFYEWMYQLCNEGPKPLGLLCYSLQPLCHTWVEVRYIITPPRVATKGATKSYRC